MTKIYVIIKSKVNFISRSLLDTKFRDPVFLIGLRYFKKDTISGVIRLQRKNKKRICQTIHPLQFLDRKNFIRTEKFT